MATPQVRNSRTIRRLVQRRCGVGSRASWSSRGASRPVVGSSVPARCRPRFAALLAREPGRCVGGHPARRAERHIGDDVVAVRTQHRFIGLDLVVRLVQQREVQAESQQKKRHRGDRQMDGQLQHLGNVGDVDESQCGVDGQDRRGEAGQSDADVARVLVNLVGRAGEPQRGADQPANACGRQRDRDPANARLDDERADRDGRGRPSRWRTAGPAGSGVAAAVKASAPSAPIMKPSMDSRVGGRSRRTTTTGTSIRSMLADRDAEPLPRDPAPPRSRRPAARRTSARRSHRSAVPSRRRARYPASW